MHDNKIQNIAVCLYGRFGTGYYCAASILAFFKTHHNVNIDFFCSTKDYDSYHTSRNANNIEENEPFKINNIKKLDPAVLTNTLIELYNPKGISIITHEQDVARRGTSWPYSFGHLFSQITESIMLKSCYEATNNMQYDLVFLTRYDVLLAPDTYLNTYISWYNEEVTKFKELSVLKKGAKLDDMQELIFENKSNSWIYAHRLQDDPELNRVHLKSLYQDMFIFGGSQAMDLIAASALLITADQCHDINEKTHIYPDMDVRDGHEGFGYLYRSSNIAVKLIPEFDGDGKYMGIRQSRHNWGGVHYTLVREFGDMSLPATSKESMSRNHWVWCEDRPYDSESAHASQEGLI